LLDRPEWTVEQTEVEWESVQVPLFACTKCDAIDNTAISGYWDQHYDSYDVANGKIESVDFKPLCSECFTGKWHGEFPKKFASVEGYVPDPKMKGFIMPKNGWNS
jgi:hypothetical protein